MTQLAPNYSVVFPFENSFDYHPGSEWFAKNWSTAYYWIVGYLIVIFGGQQWMKNRKPFQLKTPLIIWNVCLAVFAITGTIRTYPELIHSIRYNGFHHSVCNTSYHTHCKVSSFWTLLFIVSKVPELGDTVFIVLRKQRLIFLHWYHHITVLLFTWYAYAKWAAAGRWYIDMNYLVHAFMYTYYALRAMSVKVPKPLAMVITLAQIAQMFLGTFITGYALWAKRTSFCSITDSTIYAGLLMYFSYLLLFANFFRNSYMKRKLDFNNNNNRKDKVN